MWNYDKLFLEDDEDLRPVLGSLLLLRHFEHGVRRFYRGTKGFLG